MKTPTITAIVFLFCVSCSARAQAQATSISFADYHSNYELYLADPDTTNWYIIWTMEDGSELEEGSFPTKEDAEDRLLFYFLGGHERGPSAEVRELTKPPEWVYFGTFDTYAEAANMSFYFFQLGLRTKVQGVLDSSRLMRTHHLPSTPLTGTKVSVNGR